MNVLIAFFSCISKWFL